jgi:hypothetical protein
MNEKEAAEFARLESALASMGYELVAPDFKGSEIVANAMISALGNPSSLQTLERLGHRAWAEAFVKHAREYVTLVQEKRACGQDTWRLVVRAKI